MRFPWVCSVALAAAFQMASAPAAAQRAQLRAEEGPYYVDVPVRLQVMAEGFEESPQPEIEFEEPRQSRLELTGVSPNVSTSIQIINGRMSQSKRVQFAFEYRLLADAPGAQVVGPFRVSQNGKQATTGKLRLVVDEIPVSNQQRIRLVLPEGPLIVGQRVPVRLEWWAPEELSGKLFNPRLSVPFFDQLDAFRFHDNQDQSGDIALTVDTAAGPIELAATARRESEQGEHFIVRSITRQLTPLKAGELQLAPASLVVDEAVRWRRTLFGDRIPTQALKRRVEDEPRALVVQDLPIAGRPESFTGTVGRGYRLEVTADRSVVQVGDPIGLTLTLRGDEAVETAVLPSLSADGGMSPEDFRIPREKTAGAYADGAKRFEVTVRALHEGVKEIPPLAFSWFDPQRQEFQTTRSPPVALSVRPAQVVTAEDVVSAAPPAVQEQQSEREAGADRELSSESGAGGRSTTRRPMFSFTGADLAITTDIQSLLRPRGSVLASAGVQAIAYGVGLLTMLLALLSRRRALADPAELARAKELSAQRAAVAKAGKVTEVSDALRRLVATSGIHPPAEWDSFLAECDAYAFAPGGASRVLDEPMRVRALALADQLLKGNNR